MVQYTMAGMPLKLELSPGVFEPTTTTLLLAEQMNDLRGKTVLDLGCGNGPIAILAALRGAKKVYAVDIMHEACEATMHNAELNGVSDRVQSLRGDLFEPIKGMKFDVIFDDVSGMADAVSRISPWYPNTIPTGGDDGTGPTIRMLRESPRYLLDNGCLYFPVISLARVEKMIDAARDVYGEKLFKVASKLIPFCPELLQNMDLLLKLKNEGIISFSQVRSRYLWDLTIYRGAI